MAADIEETIYGRLKGWTALTALVGTRIYPNEADADQPRPLVVFGVTSRDELRDIKGNVGFVRFGVSVVVEGESKDAVSPVANQVKEAMRGQWPGVQGGYVGDESSGDTDLGVAGVGYETLLTFTVIQ